MLRDLGHEVSARGVAALYRDFVDVFVADETDAALEAGIRRLGLVVVVSDTMMTTLETKKRLARKVILCASQKLAE
jgi:LPPG:FO 2-phospho-L-lactate transferase